MHNEKAICLTLLPPLFSPNSSEKRLCGAMYPEIVLNSG